LRNIGHEPLRVEAEHYGELRRAMIWPFVALLVTSTLLVALVLYGQDAHRWVDRTSRVIAHATKVERLVTDRQARLRGFLLTREPAALTAYYEADERVPPALDELQRLVSDRPAQVARLSELQPFLERWQRYREAQVARVNDIRDPPSSHIVEGDAIQLEILSRLRQLTTVEDGLRADRSARADASTRWALLVVALLTLVGGPALALSMGQRLRRSRRQYHAALEAQERATRSLQESEERLRLAKDAANMGAWHWDLVTGELVWSDRCKALFGLAPDAVVSHEAFLASLHPDDRGSVDAALKDALWNRRSCKVEMRVPSPGGAIRWIALEGEARCDAEGQPLRMAGMAMDVTDRRRAEEQVRSERDFNLAVLDTTASLIVVLDTAAKIVRFSRACERLTGYSESDVLGKKVFELFIPGADLAGVEATFRQLRAGDFPNQHRNRWRMKDGSERLIDWSNTAIADERGRVRFIIATGIDITDREHAGEALRETEERFRVLVMATSDVVYRMSPDWTEMRQLHSPRFLPETNEPFVGWMQKYIHPDDQAHVKAAIDDAIQRGGVFELEHRVIRPDGSLGWTFSRAVPLKDSDGKITEWLGVAADRTQAKQAEEALREASRRKDEFMGVLSHELRNPLAPIRNSVHVLSHIDPGSLQAARARTIIARQVDHLARLVDDLLDVKRISSGKLRIQKERVDLGPLIRETVEDLRPLFARQSISLAVNVADRPLWVDGDRTRLAQLLGNLLHNAAKFTSSGGHVSVVVQEKEGRALLRVRDDGLGMAPETVREVFEPFIQAEKTLHRTMGGLGLGLSLVRGIAELHGGSVAANSEGVGKGAEFVVTLPTTQPAVQRAVMPAPGRPEAGAKRRVLIIEDNLDAAESLRDIVQLGGHDVMVATDGAAGLDAVREHKPDVVLCDIGLPTMDGYEVARRLRSGDGAPQARLVALSGYASAEDVDRAIRAGFDYHVAKPPHLDRVMNLIDGAPCGPHPSIPDDISTGHHEVDEQHASMLAAAARLRTATPAAVWEELRLLQRHTSSHFEYEDTLMDDIGYPDVGEHKQQHRDFFALLRVFEERLQRDGATPLNLEILATTVEKWVTEHVLGQDRWVADFIRQKAATHAEAVSGTQSPGAEANPRRLRLV
jgi:hemerythrin-like metal-binding protein/PAS domain S-box-containing protein